MSRLRRPWPAKRRRRRLPGQRTLVWTRPAAYQLRMLHAQARCVTMMLMPRRSPVRDGVRDLVLSGSLQAWTIEELLARVRKDVVTADYSTVFRAVSYLENKSLIRRVDVGDGRGRYETADRHHDHVQCDRCGRISESGTRCLLENAAEKVSKATGYKILSHHLVFTGLCPECAAAR